MRGEAQRTNYEHIDPAVGLGQVVKESKGIAGGGNVVIKAVKVEKGASIWAAANSSGWLVAPNSGAGVDRRLQGEGDRS